MVTLLMTSIAITITVLLGVYYGEYEFLISSVLRVLNYAMGINYPNETDESTFPLSVVQNNLYFNVLKFVTRLVVLNFSMITMFYYFRKTLNKDVKLHNLEKEKKKK